MTKLFKSTVQVDYEFKKLIKKAQKRGFARSFDDHFYDLLSVSNEKYSKLLRDSSTNGKCYFYALLLANFIPACKLVHGDLRNLNRNVNGRYIENFEHAWVEFGNYVFDTTAKCIINKEKYYDMFNVRVCETFRKEDLSDEKTLIRLAQNAVRLHSDLKPMLFSFEPFTAIQNKIEPYCK